MALEERIPMIIEQISNQDKRLERVEDLILDQRDMIAALKNEPAHEVLLTKLEMLQQEIQEMSDKSSKQHGELASKVDQIRTKDLPQINTEIALLKLKSGAWGALGGLIAIASLLIVEFLKRSL